MFSSLWFLVTALLFICGAVIAWQDFKHRLISLWLLLAFAVLNYTQYLIVFPGSQFIDNVIFSLIYFLLLFFAIAGYFYLKERKASAIMDAKLGWGDVVMAMAIAPALENVNIIYFFTASFVFSLMISLMKSGRKGTVPLAGFMSVFYLAYLPLRIIFQLM